MTTCQTIKEVLVTYPSPVGNCVRRLRVFPPAQRGAQRVLDLQWRCWPKADAVREGFDEFGNRVLELRHTRLQDEFCLRLALTTGREHCDAGRDENLPPTGIGAYLLPSALCNSSAEIHRTVEHLRELGQLPPKQNSQNAERLCAWSHRALKYEPGTTGTKTSVSDALLRGEGVCQDYAHLMIALCRAAQIPARYVSGYNPAEGAMHAWVEVLCGDTWQAWDPTHNRRTRPDCVYVACGRDFRDVSPVSGSYSGPQGARLETFSKTKVMSDG